jgi:hypothetical protein
VCFCMYIFALYTVFGNSMLLEVDLKYLQSHPKPHWFKPTYLPVPPLPTNSTKPARHCVGGTAGAEITYVASLHRSLKRERLISWWCHRESEGSILPSWICAWDRINNELLHSEFCWLIEIQYRGKANIAAAAVWCTERTSFDKSPVLGCAAWEWRE